MHHLYFSGTPVAHMALGATFSAMEVIPLMLLTLEAWSFIKSGEKKTRERYHMHRWAVRFLVAVGVWNFLGAGVFGFLINLPVVSYYEIGTASDRQSWPHCHDGRVRHVSRRAFVVLPALLDRSGEVE